MLAIRPHLANDYASLPDIDAQDTVQLSENEKSCLDSIGEILRNFNKHGKYGVSLLHQHFSVTDDEILIEDYEMETQTVKVQVGMKKDIDLSKYVAGNFMFSQSNTEFPLIGLEYVDKKYNIPEISHDDKPLFDSIKKALVSYKCENIFGLWVRHEPFNALDHSVMLESCDLKNRTLTCEKVSRREDVFDNNIQTYWAWNSNADKTLMRSCTRVCIKYTNGIHDAGIHH